MSLIFDALQRAEGERSGDELTAVTELLQRIENQTLATKNTETTDSSAADADAVQGHRATSGNTATVSAPENSTVTEQGVARDRDEVLARFSTIPLSLPPTSQLVCAVNNESLPAEKFRFLGVRLRHLRRTRTLNKVLVTSTIPHEGKTTVAANLAYTLARNGRQKVLLLEGDVRRPALTHMFNQSHLLGLCDYLQGDSSELANIYRFEDTSLWFLPAGKVTGNPLEVLQSGGLPPLMDRLSTLFDWVIVDSPPVLPLADTSVWMRIADGVLLVARQGTTEKKYLKEGLEALDQKKLIGAVLNSSENAAQNEHYYYYRT